MKYGKEFQQILDASDFPDDWKTSAIEYRKLKKLIKNVAAELEGMGLPPSVLQRLLVTDSVRPGSQSSVDTPVVEDAPLEDENLFEFEFEMDGAEHPAPVPAPTPVLVDPVLEDEPDELPPGGFLGKEPTHRFRLRLLSNPSSSQPPALDAPPMGSPKPLGVSEMLAISPPQGSSPVGESSRVIVHRAGAERGNVSAEYVLAGDEANPVPQIRLHVQNFQSVQPTISRSYTNDTHMSTPGSQFTDLPDSDDEDPSVPSIQEDDDEPHMPASPALMRVQTVASPIWALASAGNSDGMAKLSLGEAVDPEDEEDIIDLTTPTMAPASPISLAGVPRLSPVGTPSRLGLDDNGVGPDGANMELVIPAPQDREFIIPLQSDVAFFNVLTAALKSLSAFHADQQEKFHAAVDSLCKMVSQSIQPGEYPIVLPTPPNTGTGDGQSLRGGDYASTRVSQKDLYVWRQIFALWVESEIFESNSERDRGERTVAEAERRLQIFANEVVKRGLGDRRTLKGKRTRKAWDEFLRLNVLLLDLKRFQMANINAARKILKKHDKRTALTASTGLASFVRTTLTAHVDKDGHVSTWTFYNTSLPHVLLASLTNTLLPILPSLDDYACLICMSIAFKPIRLSCGHLFCVRCLVKMQQRRKEQCPLCRAPSVLLADKSCLDTTLMNFMRDWFPKEVREKQRENTAEIAKEQLEDAGIDTRCSIM